MNYRLRVERFFNLTLDTLYPIRCANAVEYEDGLEKIKISLTELLSQNLEESEIDIDETANSFIAQLEIVKKDLNKDIDSIFEGDPAATNHTEIILAYPGFFAIAAYRIANFLLKLGVPLIPRIITEHAHSYTGIDIHPGASIGERLCIDHGTGVVIGQTTVIGNNVKIYQGVTLGALSIPKKNIPGQRHPSIEDNVVIYSQATILGGETVIGENSIIGGNVWITESVPANSKVYYSNYKSNELIPPKG